VQSLQSTSSSAALSSGHLSGDDGSQSLFKHVGYDAKSIINYYDQRPWEVGLRLNMLGLPLLGWYFGLLTDNLLKIDGKESTERKRGAELREHLVRSKSVALIKSGQALSLRPDLLKSKIWAEELGRLVDSVGSFSDLDAFAIMKDELGDIYPKVKRAKKLESSSFTRRSGKRTRLSRLVESDPLLSMFEFYNDARSVASASIGQVYKARIRRGPVLEAAIGKEAAKRWGGVTVAVKIQRPDVAASAALDMYLIRRTTMWLSKFRGGDVVAIADTFGQQLFGELDYTREAQNCERFRGLYGTGERWDDVDVPASCVELTRKRVLVQEWIEGEKGPWKGEKGIEMVRIGLRCSTDQLLRTGLFHADPHRGNLLRTSNGHLAVIDYGMMSDIPEKDRYGLIGLVIGLKLKDFSLATENLLKLGFLDDTTQVEILVPRLRLAIKNATGGSNKASDLSFAQLQVELDEISRDNVLTFRIPPYITIIIRSLTILEGFALDVDPNFRLIRGAYPYVLKQLLNPEGSQQTPEALNDLLVRTLTVNGESKEVEWGRLRDLLGLAEKASRRYNPTQAIDEDDKSGVSRKTIELFFKFMTSKTGAFLKLPLINELAESIDGMASTQEANLIRASGGMVRPLPGGNGPVNTKRMEEMSEVFDVIKSAFMVGGGSSSSSPQEQLKLLRELIGLLTDEQLRDLAMPLLPELGSVVRNVAVEILEIRSSRAIRDVILGRENRNRLYT